MHRRLIWERQCGKEPAVFKILIPLVFLSIFYYVPVSGVAALWEGPKHIEGTYMCNSHPAGQRGLAPYPGYDLGGLLRLRVSEWAPLCSAERRRCTSPQLAAGTEGMDPGKACAQGLACTTSPITVTLTVTAHVEGMAALPGLPRGSKAVWGWQLYSWQWPAAADTPSQDGGWAPFLAVPEG